MNLPNKLTLLRIFLVPVFIACFYIPMGFSYHIPAFVIFVLAYATDMWDGYIARKRNMVTDFGKLMDPIADKLLSAAALVMLVAHGLLSPIAAIIIIGREFIISGFRLVAVGRGNVIAASMLGKLKTVSQFIAVVLLLLWPMLPGIAFPLDQIAVWVSVALTIWSGVEYIVKNKTTLQTK